MVSSFEAGSQEIQKWVGLLLSFLIFIDAVACLFFVGVIYAFFVILLYPVMLLLRRFVSLT
jgi:uncharacterized membrane protein